MSKVFLRTFAAVCAPALAMVFTTIAHAQSAGPNQPVLSGSYGWEDGRSTILGSNAPTNVTAVNVSDFVHSGTNALRVTESPHTSGAVHIYLGHIRNLNHGDIIRASFWTYDDVLGTQPRVRIWAHNTSGEDVAPVAQAGGNETYSAGIGWEEITNDWTFNAFQAGCSNIPGGCDGLVIQARLYSTPNNCETCSTDYWFDDFSVEVYCASNPDLTINFADGTVIDGPLTPGDPCEPATEPATCDTDWVTGAYGWEDGEGTMIGTNFSNNITAVNQGDFALSGAKALKVTESPNASGTPQVWLAHVRNLVDGDVITGGFWTFDNTPGVNPSVRIWAHYTNGSSLASVSPAFGPSEQNQAFSAGIGWEQMSNTWTFDSNGGARDGILIHARIFSPTCNDEHPGFDPITGQCATEFWFDDVSVEVCAANPQSVLVHFPDAFLSDPDPPIDMCDKPALVGGYGWEDGKGTFIGVNNGSAFITGTNSTELVNSGQRALKITESPNAPDTPQIHVAFIENLQNGDTIRASIYAYDDTPGASPSVRIWGRYAQSGNPQFPTQSAGGNETFTSGIGWEKLEHIWEFDGSAGSPTNDALLIHVRVFAPPCNPDNPTWDPDTETCSTDYFVDDLFVEVCSDHPNATITFPDGTVIGDPSTPGGCIADVDGSGNIDLFDLFAVIGAWGTADPNADVNGDGQVDGADLGIVAASLGPCTEFLFPMPGSAQLLFDDTPATGGLRQYDLSVKLDPGEALVNIYDANVTSSLGFAGGSFITIGANEPHFDIVEDPNFDFTAFSSGTSLGDLAGWYNFDPANNLGLADLYPDNRVLIARFFVDPDTKFDAELSVTFEDDRGRARQVSLNLGPDVRPCPGDLTGSGAVGVADLLALLACWGPVTPGSSCEAADLTASGAVGVADLLQLLSQWGPCPE